MQDHPPRPGVSGRALLAIFVAVTLFVPLVGTFFRHSEVPAAVILALAGVGIAHLGAEGAGSS